MTNGEWFATDGYDIVASAQCDRGEVVALNNNSSHYLVAETLDDDTSKARLLASFAYADYRSSGAFGAYSDALSALWRFALARSESLQEVQ